MKCGKEKIKDTINKDNEDDDEDEDMNKDEKFEMAITHAKNIFISMFKTCIHSMCEITSDDDLALVVEKLSENIK